jgi:hypothetical protein
MERYKDKSREFKVEIQKLLITRESTGYSIAFDHGVKMRKNGDSDDGSIIATGGENKFFSNDEITEKIEKFLRYIENITVYGE